MTDFEKAIAMAYTGVCFLQGDKLKAFYDYAKMLMGREVFTHEIPDIAEELKEKSKDDFLAICACDYETEPRRRGRWIETINPADGLPGLYQEKHHCSVCGYERYGALKYSTNFCGNCGAKMDQEGAEQNAAD